MEMMEASPFSLMATRVELLGESARQSKLNELSMQRVLDLLLKKEN